MPFLFFRDFWKRSYRSDAHSTQINTKLARSATRSSRSPCDRRTRNGDAINMVDDRYRVMIFINAILRAVDGFSTSKWTNSRPKDKNGFWIGSDSTQGHVWWISGMQNVEPEQKGRIWMIRKWRLLLSFGGKGYQDRSCETAMALLVVFISMLWWQSVGLYI